MNADISDRVKENAGTKVTHVTPTVPVLQMNLIHLIKNAAEIATIITYQAKPVRRTAEICVHMKNAVAQAILKLKTQKGLLKRDVLTAPYQFFVRQWIQENKNARLPATNPHAIAVASDSLFRALLQSAIPFCKRT